ncbi:MAG: hypothetical protein M1515_01735 [Candidatus Thermoplasmatota archaeon]|jgi:predicted transcriptional regulator|nr:hypothetical protein [Candidatus Thermoplasmatota archaeon]
MTLIIVENGYAITILNKVEDYVIKPFLSDIPKVDRLIVILNKNSGYDQPESKIKEFFDLINVKIDLIYVNDVTNFFQIFLLVKSICGQSGSPSWVNISCGSGIGMSALAIFSVNRNIPMVIYEKETDRTIMVSPKKIQKMDIFDPIYVNLIKDIAGGKNTIRQLATSNRIDKSTVSRRLKNLISMEIVDRMDNSRHAYKFSLSEFGRWFLENFRAVIIK